MLRSPTVKTTQPFQIMTTNETIRADGCVIADDRTPDQRKTHTLAIVAKDKGMSGWGRASNGVSRCGWAFDPSKVNSDHVFNWVKSRSEMRYVNLVDLRTYRAPRGTAHFHLYVCDEDHVAARY